jgi:hypothetical protein
MQVAAEDNVEDCCKRCSWKVARPWDVLTLNHCSFRWVALQGAASINRESCPA